MVNEGIHNLPNLQSKRGIREKVPVPSIGKKKKKSASNTNKDENNLPPIGKKESSTREMPKPQLTPKKEDRLGKKGEKTKEQVDEAQEQAIAVKKPAQPAVRPKIDRDNLEFMTDVDAAIYRKGHPFAFILSSSAVLFIIIFLVWAHFAVIDQVTRGTGQIIASQRTQEIQNLEGGILEQILVQDGDVVQKGQILATINNQSAESFYKDKLSQYYESMGAVAQLRAFLDDKAPQYPEELQEKAPNVIAHQNEILASARAKMESELLVLDNQLKQRVQEQREVQNNIQRAKQSLALAKEQRNIARPLLNQGIYSRVDYLALEQKIVDLEGEISSSTISLSRVESGIAEAKQRIELRKSEIRAQALADLTKYELELTSAREAIATGGDRVARLEIRSPLQATVKRILIRTAGGVIKPGETIMELVPLDDTLLVEARINPQDRGFIHPGQRAVVKVSSFDYSIYGGLDATVEQISADTLEDRRGEFYYLVTLRTDSNVIKGRGETLPIIPGMTATVDILTGSRTILDYLLKPILKAKSQALSER